jgi:IS5 family transposase
MLRIHLLQQWYGLSDPAAEDALYEITSMRQFAGLSLARDRIPDESTILQFRHLLEKHQLTEALFSEVNGYLEDKGRIDRGRPPGVPDETSRRQRPTSAGLRR